jgi:hypothetical protein
MNIALSRRTVTMHDINLTQCSALADKRLNFIDGFHIVTDRLDYRPIDQVSPIFAEQQFFLDELQHEKIDGSDVLEIGLGTGVLLIGALRRGARRVNGKIGDAPTLLHPYPR